MSESLSEFSLIHRHFASLTPARDDVILGPGDDAAVLDVRPGHQLVVSTDTLVAERHFLLDTLPYDLAFKSVMVNLSDLAAMGAEPAWITLALTVPEPTEEWFHGFARGLHDALIGHQVQLIGGDLTRGPLSVTATVHGWIPTGQAISRAGAEVGDLIYVSGDLGAAALGLQTCVGRIRTTQQERDVAMAALNRPQAQVLLGTKLRGVATAMIDISDGLVSDLGHILQASGVGARIKQANVPVATCALTAAGLDKGFDLAWAGGDDYQLCFTAKPSAKDVLKLLSESTGVTLSRIGECIAEPGCQLVDSEGGVCDSDLQGFQHF